ncbi:MAG TPA: YciI family protein [Candidatus Limnocylindrales bacterium]|nr:YciI family protein [Candidatus Limnocylindrales bacterium]
MKFLLFICVDPELPFDEQPGEINGWVDRAGAARLDGGPLRPPRTALTVRVRDGERVATDGPFATTKEFVAGFDLIECATREDAVEIAAVHPVARFGAIEVRQLVDD